MNARPAIPYSETQLQASAHDLMCRFRLPGVVWHHSPNELARDVKTIVQQKRIGMMVGWPDWNLYKPANPWPKPYMLEFKKPGGSMSDDQWTVRKITEAIGVEYAVCRDVERFIEQMEEWGLIRKGIAL